MPALLQLPRVTAWTTRCIWIWSRAPSTLTRDSRCIWVAAARNRGEEDRNSPSPGGWLTARAFSSSSSPAIGSGEKNAHRLNRCSASGVSSAVDMVQVCETATGSSGSCSLSSRCAFWSNWLR